VRYDLKVLDRSCLRFMAANIRSDPTVLAGERTASSAKVAMRRDQAWFHVGRVTGGIAYRAMRELQRSDRADGRATRCGRPAFTVIRIDVLSDQRDSRTPASASRSISSTILATGRETSAPRVYGTTQKVQNLSQPSCTVTKELMPRARVTVRLGGASTLNLSSTGIPCPPPFRRVRRAQEAGRR